MKSILGIICTLLCGLICQADAAMLFDRAATWRWRPGTNEASSPVAAWRTNEFSDSQFTTAPAPFWFGDVLPGGTQITGMSSVYGCIFLRLPFVVTNISEISGLRLGALVDDGFVAWINGTEVQRVNMPDPPGTEVAITNLAQNATEPVPFSFYNLPDPSAYLVPGTNLIAVQVFQSALASSDLGFDASLEAILVETNPPTIVSVDPPAGSTVYNLTQITVTFSEPVTGVDAFDLRVNGAPVAVGMTPISSSTYVFALPQPAYGALQVTWIATHGIADQAVPPNPFDASAPGATWQYNLADNTPPVVSTLAPAESSTVQSLTNVTVMFSEPVAGVDAADLRINGNPATGLLQSAPDFYTFSFPQPATGLVQIAWAPGHGITDLAPAANAFAGGNWIYSLNPAAEALTPFISEFMASNTRTLADEDGDFSDWIEIYNPSGLPVNLDGWFLTDTTNDLAKWRFPATNLAGGKFLVVFASEKNRRVPGARLHTNFRLSGGGEYVALVKPDGVTVVSEYTFPSQAADVSYGLGSLTTNQTVITSNTPVRVRVPANDTDGLSWTMVGYDDSAWTAGTNGVGYGTTNATSADYSAIVAPTQPVGFWRLDESSGTTAANIGSGGTAMNASYSGATLGTAGPRPPSFNGFEVNNNAPTFNGSSAFVAGPPGLLSGRSAFTLAGWVKPNATPGSRIGLFGQNDSVEFGFINPTTLECWTPSGGSLDAPYTPVVGAWFHVVAVGDGTTIRIFVNGALIGTGGTATSSYGSSSYNFNIGGNGIFDTTGNFFNGQIDEVVAYHRALSTNEIAALYRGGLQPAVVPVTPYVRTDVGPAMSNVNASAYVRLPFTVDEPTTVAQLTLRVRYDDGFVAYINGTKVAQANAPDLLAFNSAATNTHSPGSVEEFRIGGLALHSGINVLAIQGLNRAAADEDFLVAADLVITYVAASSSSPLYFSPATPGAENVGGVLYPGPSITEASHTPNVPLEDQDVVVTARVVPAFDAVSAVVLRYRIMFTNEIEVPMLDDGLHGDGEAGDGVYGATIPASASTNGQMIRWFVRATDALGNQSRWPLFNAPNDSAEYLGTIVEPINLTSKLPIFHLFAAPGVLQAPRITPATTQIGADSEAGGRVSLFYDGEFYDNISMELRGNTSAGQNKKSHRVVFNREHRFRHLPGYPRVRKTSLMAEFLDPTYLRQHLCFWLLDQMGVPSPYFYPVRAQLNGAFYGLVFHNDVIDQEQVERLGYDPAGALYKAAGQCNPAENSTGVFEKKTEPLSDHSDYQALVRPINETNTLAGRRIAAFDRLDIPEVINYLAGARWCAENDDVWANMSLYRDTYGDGLWRIIPFDMNASWGQRYGGITPLDAIADNCKSHPLYGCSTIIACDGSVFNRIYDVIIQVPETRQMLLRRERTVLDRWALEPATDPQSRLLESHIRYMTNLIWTEAFLDRASWGYSTWTASNKPLTNAVNELFNEFINLRRIHFSVTHNITNVAKPIGLTPTSNAGIPLTQPINSSLDVVAVDYNPSSANQSQEFVCLTNPRPYAVDISGWSLDRGVNFTFKPGTIVPSNSVIYVSPDVVAFRARSTGPQGGQGLFVVGPYKGQLSARGETIEVRNDQGVVVSSFVYPGASTPAQSYLRVTEIMYNPAPQTGSTNLADAFEYIELKNISTTVTLSLAGVRFANGIVFDFTGSAVTSLAPGQRVLVVANTNAFVERYGAGLNVAGQYAPSALNNGGERLQLLDASGEEILDFSFNNAWYPVTDGLGFSLVVVDENAEPDLWNSKSNWRPSGQVNGNPGAADPGPAAIVPVVINEALTHSPVPPPSDTIELFNPTVTDADLSGWFLTDDFIAPKKYRIPDGTILHAGGYIIFNEDQFNPGGLGFALSSAGDEVCLFSADTSGNLTGYYHRYDFGAAEPNVSFGRLVTSDGQDHFVPQTAQTLGTNNAAPKVGPVVITEVMYHPPELSGGADNSQDEFIELFNAGTAAVPLYDTNQVDQVWQIKGGVDFAFPANTSLAPGEYALVVNFSPTNAGDLAAFRAHYGVGAAVQIFGPYSGKLNNNSDNILLKKPTLLDPGVYDLALVDEVRYSDVLPWPQGADGYGLSLQRRNAALYGSEPTNWLAAVPTTAAAAATSGQPPSITIQPVGTNVLVGNEVVLSVTAQGDVPLRYQWRANGANVPNATNASLTLSSIQPEEAGVYQVVVYNNSGSVVSSETLVNLRGYPASILSQPLSVAVFPLQNASFSVTAYSPSPITYQWRRETTDIDQATNSVLTLTNLQPAQAGAYRVLVHDASGDILSAPATLTVITNPVFATQPTNRVAIYATNLTVSLVASANSSTPVRYRWFYNGVPLTNGPNVFGATNATLTLSNVQASSEGYYAVAATDNYGTALSTNAMLTVLVKAAYVLQPASQTVAAGQPLTIAAQVSGTPPFYYRWRTNSVGTNVFPGPDSISLQIPSASQRDAAIYQLVVSNAIATSVTSSNAYVVVIDPPVSQTAAPGSTVTFRALLSSPTASPAYTNRFSWIFNGTNVLMLGTNRTTNAIMVFTNELVLTNVSAANVGSYTFMYSNYFLVTNQVVVTNPPAPPVTNQVVTPIFHGAPAAFTAQLMLGSADTDGDGMPDDWETAHGLNPNDPSDASADADGDGMTNLQEYLAGTDPQSAQSYLKIEAAGTVAGGGQVVSFVAVSNHTYTVLYRTNLATALWQKLADVQAEAATREVRLTNSAAAVPERYYRLVTPKL